MDEERSGALWAPPWDESQWRRHFHPSTALGRLLCNICLLRQASALRGRLFTMSCWGILFDFSPGDTRDDGTVLYNGSGFQQKAGSLKTNDIDYRPACVCSCLTLHVWTSQSRKWNYRITTLAFKQKQKRSDCFLFYFSLKPAPENQPKNDSKIKHRRNLQGH